MVLLVQNIAGNALVLEQTFMIKEKQAGDFLAVASRLDKVAIISDIQSVTASVQRSEVHIRDDIDGIAKTLDEIKALVRWLFFELFARYFLKLDAISFPKHAIPAPAEDDPDVIQAQNELYQALDTYEGPRPNFTIDRSELKPPPNIHSPAGVFQGTFRNRPVAIKTLKFDFALASSSLEMYAKRLKFLPRVRFYS